MDIQGLHPHSLLSMSAENRHPVIVNLVIVVDNQEINETASTWGQSECSHVQSWSNTRGRQGSSHRELEGRSRHSGYQHGQTTIQGHSGSTQG